MDLEVRLFAILRERAGRDRLTVALPVGSSVARAIDEVSREPGLGEALHAMPVGTALNREYVGPDARIQPGSELALIPPISGGEAPPVQAAVGDGPLSVGSLAQSVTRPGAGAIVVFCGVTREVDRLEYEAYAEMANARIEAVLADCVERHDLQAAAAQHRTGDVALGEPSVVVAVSAAHRAEAFAGAREAIDRIKAEAPIWKQEVTSNGLGGAEVRRRVEGTPAGLTHLDHSGSARMVDVSGKPVTARRAAATARVRMSGETAGRVARGDAAKGDVLGTARIAAMAAAKRTWELIPLAHSIPLDHLELEGSVDVDAGLVRLDAVASTEARTGVEMEAMTACAVAALTVYDMVKGIERGVSIEAVELVSKSGGRSGAWERGR
jgi:molybdenum cofactor biosynthesis protein MoaC